jgi:hypothetical protein
VDATHFDRLIKALATAGTRRGVLSFLSALPVAATLTVLHDDESVAKRRRHNRQKHNQRRSGHRKANRKGERRNERQRPPVRDCSNVLKKYGCFRFHDGVSEVWKCPANTHMESANLTSCDLRGAIMKSLHLRDAKLDWAILNNAHFDGSQAEHVDMADATAVHASFVGTNLGSSSSFGEADLRFADFTGASLNGARMKDAELQEAILEKADLRNITWNGAWCPDDYRAGSCCLFHSTCCGHLNGYHTEFC